PPDPVFLPAEMEILGVPESYRLQRVDQDVAPNSSLHTRTETFLLLRATSQPLVQATYPPFSTRQVTGTPVSPAPPQGVPGPATIPVSLQEVPTESPPGSAAWAIRAVSLESSVSPAEPVARNWDAPRDWDHSRARDLPCVTLHAHHRGRVARGTCHLQVSATLGTLGTLSSPHPNPGIPSLLQAPLGVCVVELEIPPRWFSLGSLHSHRSRRRDSDSSEPPERPEPAELRYSVGECGGREREAPRVLGMLELRAGEPERQQEVRLDEKVLLRVPNVPLRPGQRFTATIALHHNFTADSLTLRIKAKKGLQVLSARPAIPGAWSAHLERSRGPKHSTAVVTCRRLRDIPAIPDSSRASEPAVFLHLDVAVENGTGGLAPARPLTWQVEYPGQDPEAQKDKLVWEIQVSERDIRALVPLVQELEILNTAPLTGIPRVIPVKLVAVEAGGGVSELTDPVGCESADKQVLQVSPAVPLLSRLDCKIPTEFHIPLQVSDSCDLVFVGGKESRGARGARVDFWARRLRAELSFSVWAPLLPLRVQLGDPVLEQLRGWRLPGGPDSGTVESEDPGEEPERRARGCRPQFQRTALRVLAHFVAHPLDGGRHLSYLPGPEWLLDVTHLVAARTRVQDPRVASLEAGAVVVGREPGVTSVEV
ncbi:T132A protein, partial [Pachycephala philippinensis]|nr:T132A protein [Pachycephala philippinensis]